MKNLDSIADELFNKIRGRFPNITVGDNQATITNKPKKARFFEFDFAEGKKVNVNIDEDSLTIMYAQNLFSEQETTLKSKWFVNSLFKPNANIWPISVSISAPFKTSKPYLSAIDA